ncbi:MAG: molybdopterin oxidoreductase, partial [Ignavibacteriae bacterium HGW-Ignavibacteriae-3]
ALLAASTALTATACTDYHDKGEIIPYNKRPEEILPGVANYYASTCNGCGMACGILIKTREGRPVKVDGNPDHPINKGKICAKGQANILSLYDPERLRYPMKSGKEISWKKADGEIISVLNDVQREGREIAVITGQITSPTTKKVLDNFVSKYSKTKIYSHSLFNDSERRNAWFQCYGTYDYPSVKFDEANIILALDADFLGNEGNYIENMRKYVAKRDVAGKTEFNRLYVAEGRFSSTGMMADYRMRVAPDQQSAFVYNIISALVKNNPSIALDASVRAKLTGYSKVESVDKDKFAHLIKDLADNRGRSIIYAGDTLSGEVHIAVNLLNEILGNNALYNYTSAFKSLVKESTKEELSRLVDSMKSGKAGVVIHFDSNPVYTFPSDLDYASALRKIQTVISLTESENESSVGGTYTLPLNHPFESWGDAFVRSGIYSLQQPVISTIFNTRQKESILLTWISGNPDSYKDDTYHQFLMNNFNNEVYSRKNRLADPKTFWYSVLHDGVIEIEEKAQPAKFNISAFSALNNSKKGNGYSLHLTESYYVGDGRFANNGWLQETPHPVSKVAWDNYASISPLLAKQLSVEMNDLVEVSVNGKKLILPALVQPGVEDKTINIELGYGRSVAGDVGSGVGFNANIFITKNQSSPYVVQNVFIKKADGKHVLSSTQEHHAIDDTFVKDLHRTRRIIQEGTVEKYKKDPGFLHTEKQKFLNITNQHEYTGNKWAMAIDLNKCTSCSACVTACNVENNVPVVGKEQVELGREMQWMRIDRYYSGTPEDPIVSNQPMLCQHCDDAPCENVCPVNATNHSPDGLNQMVYNRCVGTRYCSNNCPYKVRRFNFYNFRDHFADAYYENDLTAMVHNPEVTVRSRGVMEKCTFCVHKIMEARSKAIRDGKELQGSDIVTACQQACPTTAITFGDANDPSSAIAKLREHNLSYHVLEELNVKPNVTYIAKLRNTHSEEIL